MAYSTQTLASGCFGKIYKEKYGDAWAALKRVPVGLISKHQLDRECKVYHNARHPNVVKLLGDPWLKDSKWNIPMEFISGEDLETTIFKVQASKIQLTPVVKATIITGMCEGLLHLHSKDIVHQDLKPDNIMVEHQTYRAVIIDLGLAKFSRNGLSSAINLGNEAYSPPEVLQMDGVRDKRSDVWAMGKIIAELCARIRLPTQFVSATKIREKLGDQPFCGPVSRMVEVNPNDRSSMAGVIADIRRAAAIQQADNRAKDVTKDFTRDVTRDITRAVPRDIARDVPREITRDIPQDITRAVPRDMTRDVTRDITRDVPRDITRYVPRDMTRDVTRDITRDVPRDITRDVTRDITRDMRDVTMAQGNDLRINKWSPLALTSPKGEVNKSPTTYYRQDQQRDIGKALVPAKGEAFNKHLSLMSFPCPLPETGKVTEQSYNEEKGALVYKEIVTKGGRIIKYEKVQITKDA